MSSDSAIVASSSSASSGAAAGSASPSSSAGASLDAVESATAGELTRPCREEQERERRQ